MIPPAFDYHAPQTVGEALTLLGSLGSDAKLLAGGHSLLPMMKLRFAQPAHLIDLNRIPELRGICEDGNTVVIGAMTVENDLIASPVLKARVPLLAEAPRQIADPQVRNRGTIGGSLANNDQAACYPAAVLGLGATIHTNQRTLTADEFFAGLYTTALAEGEIITAVKFPRAEKAGWQKFKQPASRFSLVGVFVSKGPAGVRVAVTGAGASGVFRATGLEAKLAANWSAAALAGATVPSTELNSDLHGSAEYRAALIPVLAARAVG